MQMRWLINTKTKTILSNLLVLPFGGNPHIIYIFILYFKNLTLLFVY